MKNIVPIVRASILAGLPGEGPEPKCFNYKGKGCHSEGFVVRFDVNAESRTSWVGNFVPSWTSKNILVPHPDGIRFLIVAGGQGYFINGATGELHGLTIFPIQSVLILEGRGQIAVSSDLVVELWGSDGHHWTSNDVFDHGVELQRADASHIYGKARCSSEDGWFPFSLDLRTSEVVFTGRAKPIVSDSTA